jgi:hypothetical protein
VVLEALVVQQQAQIKQQAQTEQMEVPLAAVVVEQVVVL